MTDLDEWIAGVDQLLDGQRADPTVSDDAMRWSPEPPTRNRPPSISEFVQDFFAHRRDGRVEPSASRAPSLSELFAAVAALEDERAFARAVFAAAADTAVTAFGRLTDLSWYHHRTGAFIGCRLHMTPAMLDRIRQAAAAVASAVSVPGGADVATLYGIPVVVEPNDASWDWQLRRGDQIIESWPHQPPPWRLTRQLAGYRVFERVVGQTDRPIRMTGV